MKPVIAIPAYKMFREGAPYSPFVYATKHTFIQAVERAGGLPLIVPMYENEETAASLLAIVDGLLLADGNDISSENYGEAPRDIRDNDPERDAFELALLRSAEKRHMPVLGVCRGMQLMNVGRGGTLYQNLATERQGSDEHDGYRIVKDTQYLAHELQLEQGTELARIIGASTIKSNTHHHQAVKELGENLVVNARAKDGVIEGIEDSSGPYFLGVQPHPESIFQHAEPSWKKLFESFIAAAQKFKTEEKN